MDTEDSICRKVKLDGAEVLHLFCEHCTSESLRLQEMGQQGCSLIVGYLAQHISGMGEPREWLKKFS